jgi:hypothetical protein
LAYDLTAVLTLKDNMTRGLRSVMGALRNTQRTTDTYRDSMGRLRDAQGRFVRGAGGFKSAAGSMVSGLAGLTLAAGATGLALGGIQKAMDFESQMSTIKALTGATSAEMKKMTDLAMEMGAKTKYDECFTAA